MGANILWPTDPPSPTPSLDESSASFAVRPFLLLLFLVLLLLLPIPVLAMVANATTRPILPPEVLLAEVTASYVAERDADALDPGWLLASDALLPVLTPVVLPPPLSVFLLVLVTVVTSFCPKSAVLTQLSHA